MKIVYEVTYKGKNGLDIIDTFESNVSAKTIAYNMLKRAKNDGRCYLGYINARAFLFPEECEWYVRDDFLNKKLGTINRITVMNNEEIKDSSEVNEVLFSIFKNPFGEILL